jgi:NitT/TauT family transport system substrate-binding protein
MPRGVHRRGLCARLGLLVLASTLVTTLTSCGLVGESDDGGAPKAKPEKSTLKVVLQLTSDVVPFHLANQEGFFEEEGLKVDFVDVPTSEEATRRLLNGRADVTFATYIPFILTESEKSAEKNGGLKIVAEGSSAGPGNALIVAPPNSKVKSVQDMEGARVATPDLNTMADMLTNTTCVVNGVDYKKINWIRTPFPVMADAMKRGVVDAAFVTEPFIQATMRDAGAQPIFDTATGPTADMPAAGWASTGNFVKENPNTIAAFQRAMQKATQLALSDRGRVEQLLMKFSKVDVDIAKMAVLQTFQSKLDARRIQRVADIMLLYKVIPNRVDVSDMIGPTAPLDG